MQDTLKTYTVFSGTTCLCSAELPAMLLQTKAFLEANPDSAVLIFNDQTGQQIDFDFRGTSAEVLQRVEVTQNRAGPGRPRLGVVAREITLLPRHWEWLEQQPNGISAALRRLVDEAQKRNPVEEQARLARDAASKFIWAMAGNLPGFEEASRALFAKDYEHLERLILEWPHDIRAHFWRMVQVCVRLEAGGAARETPWTSQNTGD